MNNTLQEQTTGSRVAVYYELTKPKIWYLLVFTAFGAALTASNIYNIPIFNYNINIHNLHEM